LYDALAALRQQERDLKRQLRRVQQLNEKLDVLSLVASNTDHSVVITDRNGLIEWVNDGFSRITGYEPLDVVGKKPGELLQGAQTDPQTVERIRAGLRSGNSFTEEILNYHKDGHSYWIAMNIFPVRDQHGNVVRYMAIQNDVTNHLQVEEDLHTAKDAAEKANRAKSELLANMSHEIRTPMNAVIGMTDLLFDTKLDSEQLEYLSIVKESAHSLLRLLDDVLDFSKIEAGKLELEAVTFNLRDALAATIKPFAPRAGERGLDLSWEVAPNVPQRVVGDPQRWRQVLTNLVGNAVKFTLAGHVVVRLELASQSNDAIQIRGLVRDTGIGIPAEKLEHIFESFSQADSSTTRRFGGSGLGLTITAQLVAMMGGRVWVESCEGTGSTFVFTTTFAPALADGDPAGNVAQHLAAQSSGDRPAPTRRLTVLVAEDIPANQKLVQRILEKRGHQAVLASDGREALELFRQQPFDAVLMDVQMPEQDGLRTATAIRELEQGSGRRTPIIAVTAHALPVDRDACLASGMDAYLAKPLDARGLVAVVEGLVGISFAPQEAPAERPSAPATAQPAAHPTAKFDFPTALARMEDDLELFAQLSQFFLEDGPALLGDIERACKDEDPRLLERAAHNLKGLVRNFEAREASQLAERLESLGRKGKTTGGDAVCQQLSSEVERLIVALRDFQTDTSRSEGKTGS
jgi:PAS domain S-box-containing protein